MKKNRGQIAVVGGGIAGLTAAITLARAGKKVALFEKSREAGGRARTKETQGCFLNRGPHALYRNGKNREILERFDIQLGRDYDGGYTPSGMFLRDGDSRHPIPFTARDILFSKYFGIRNKVALFAFFSRLNKMKRYPAPEISMADWAQENIKSKKARDYVLMITRLTTFYGNPAQQSAASVLKQLQLGMGGVMYVSGGWQTLVNALLDRARKAGVEIRTGEAVREIKSSREIRSGREIKSDRAPLEVVLAGKDAFQADAVILALDPRTARKLAGEGSGLRPDRLRPVRIACLDVALGPGCPGEENFSMGVDRPLYFSDHSSGANLAPEGWRLVHCMKYLSDNSADENTERELEKWLDASLPGRRSYEQFKRYLPDLVVSRIPNLEDGAERPDVQTGIRGVYIAGDWVGPEGMLADAAFASGERAALVCLEESTGTREKDANGPDEKDAAQTPEPGARERGESHGRDLRRAV